MCYNAFIRSARFFPALLAMSACHAVLLTPSISLRLTQALSCTQVVRETPQIRFYVFNSLRTLSFSVSRKPCVCHSYENCRVCTNNSQSGTRYSPISTRLAAAQGPARVGGPARLSRSPARRGGQLSRSVFIYPLFFLPLAHSFALSCTLRKLNPFIFSRFRTLCEKYPGWGERVVLVFLTKGFSIRASLSAPRCDPRLPAARRPGKGRADKLTPLCPAAPPCRTAGPGVHSIRIRQECRQSHVPLHVGR